MTLPPTLEPHWRRCWLPSGLLPQHESIASLTPLELNDPTTCHYLRAVCRVKTGEWLTGVSPPANNDLKDQGWCYPVQVQAASRTAITLGVALHAGKPSPTSPWPWKLGLACGFLKEAVWDELLPQATALGVDVIQPLLTERTQNPQHANDRISKRAERTHTLLATAALQCERATLPQLAKPKALRDWLTDLSHHDGVVVFRERFSATTPILKIVGEWQGLHILNTQPTLWCVVGPEGGWSDAEAEQWDALALSHFQDEVKQTHFWQTCISPWILRSELAAIASLTLLSVSFL